MSTPKRKLAATPIMTRIGVLTLQIEGRRITYAAPIGDKDPMEMTLGEWKSYPYLTSIAMLDLIPGNRTPKEPK